MKSLITVGNKVFEDNDPEAALEKIIDRALQGCYPLEDVFKMVKLAERCLKEDPRKRPEMREVVDALSHLVMLFPQWEASLGDKSQVFRVICNPKDEHFSPCSSN